MKPDTQTIIPHTRRLSKARSLLIPLAAMAGLLATSSVAPADILTGDSITGTLVVSGGGNWLGFSPSTQSLPASFTARIYTGPPFLTLTIGTDGLLSVTPSASSCSIGCTWNTPAAVYGFTLNTSAPDITGVTTISSDSNLGISFTLVNSHEFYMNMSGSGQGTYNQDFTTAQLSSVPEPASIFFVALGLLGFAFLRRTWSRFAPKSHI